MITGIEYIKMSKHDIYKEYCKIYREYEIAVEQKTNRLKAELNAAKAELLLSYMQNPMVRYERR